MIITAQNMFTALLDGLNKEETGTVTPAEGNRLLNLAQEEWIKNRYSEVEMTQKRTDDLRVLEARDVLPNVGVNQPGGEVFELPYSETGFVTTPGNPNGDNNGYMFLLNCAFRIQYVENDCNLTGISGFMKSKRMTADKEFEVVKDPYNKPTDNRLYHKMIGQTIRCITGTQSFGVEVLIDYLRYPRAINIPVPTANTDVPCELPFHAREEIVRIAIRKKLGIYESPRYQQAIAEDSQSIT